MKIVLQRVKNAHVSINNDVVGKIDVGYVLLVGFEREDDSRFLEPMLEKIRKIKLFSDEEGRFAFSLEEASGSLLIVSQFTLFADLKKGKKPSWSKALAPEIAKDLYHEFVRLAKNSNIPVQSGEFGAYMQIFLQNEGPVTIILDSRELFPSLY